MHVKGIDGICRAWSAATLAVLIAKKSLAAYEIL